MTKPELELLAVRVLGERATVSIGSLFAHARGRDPLTGKRVAIVVDIAEVVTTVLAAKIRSFELEAGDLVSSRSVPQSGER